MKIIEVAPGHRLSLQRHFKRAEYWIVVSGDGLAELDGRSRRVQEGDLLRVETGCVHRVANDATTPLLIVEVQKGECREDDIERLEDDYKRCEARHIKEIYPQLKR